MKATVQQDRPAQMFEALGETGVSDSPTRLVQQLLGRRRANTETAHPHVDTTATVAIMLRVQPVPIALLAVDVAARPRLREALEDAGFEVCAVKSGDEAIEAMSTRHHPLVVTDRLDCIRRLREMRAARLLQIVVVTGTREWEGEAAIRAGADECLEAGASEGLLRARFVAARRMADLECALRTTLVEGRRLATTDELTGVANRRFFASHFPREIARAARFERPVSVVMCDIDHFKRVNDQYGHSAGDAVLREFAHRLQECLRRGTDWVARLGGEEFAIVLSETSLDQALPVCRKLREVVRGEPFRHGGTRIPVTASFGVAGVDTVPREPAGLAERLLSVADRALYRCKEAGRDRVAAGKLQVDPT